jgi:hypothetical protein
VTVQLPASSLQPPASGNPYDGTAAQMVPQAVEKLPLFRWRPGARLLVIGSRDGAAFDHDLASAEGRSFRRPLDAVLVAAAQAHSRCDGLALAWSSTLAFPLAVEACLQACRGALVVCSNGHGDAGLLERLLPLADAWQLAVGSTPGPLVQRILDAGRHVEVLAGWSDPADPLPPLDLARASAVHLVPRSSALGSEEPMRAAYAVARSAFAGPLYDEAHQRDECACGETLVWRTSGRSRLDTLTAEARCRACGRVHPFILGANP